MIRRIANQRLDVKWIDRMWVRGRAPQHSMLLESRVTWPWPGPSSPQSSILHTCTNILLLLLIKTKVECAWGLNTAKQVAIFLSYDDGQMRRTYCILSVPVFLFWIHFQWTFLYLYRTYLHLYRNSWPRGNIQSGRTSRYSSAATDLFGADSKAALRSFSDVVLFQFVFFFGRILSLKTAIALNAPQNTAIGFCQQLNNWPFFANIVRWA